MLDPEMIRLAEEIERALATGHHTTQRGAGGDPPPAGRPRPPGDGRPPCGRCTGRGAPGRPAPAGTARGAGGAARRPRARLRRHDGRQLDAAPAPGAGRGGHHRGPGQAGGRRRGQRAAARRFPRVTAPPGGVHGRHVARHAHAAGGGARLRAAGAPPPGRRAAGPGVGGSLARRHRRECDAPDRPGVRVHGRDPASRGPGGADPAAADRPGRDRGRARTRACGRRRGASVHDQPRAASRSSATGMRRGSGECSTTCSATR